MNRRVVVMRYGPMFLDGPKKLTAAHYCETVDEALGMLKYRIREFGSFFWLQARSKSALRKGALPR